MTSASNESSSDNESAVHSSWKREKEIKEEQNVHINQSGLILSRDTSVQGSQPESAHSNGGVQRVEQLSVGTVRSDSIPLMTVPVSSAVDSNLYLLDVASLFVEAAEIQKNESRSEMQMLPHVVSGFLYC